MLLVEAFSRIEIEPSRKGMRRVSGTLEPRLTLPFVRALMRVEAELLLDDANKFIDPAGDLRTSRQRSADAFVALVLRVHEALGGEE